MESKKAQIFTLALEELALTLGLVGEPSIANQLLINNVVKIKPEEVDTRLDVAIHSMLARGLCGINLQGKPTLDKQLQEAVELITNFDKIIYMTLVINKLKVESNIRINKKGQFLVQTISPDGIYTLEYYKKMEEIYTYLGKILESGTKLNKEVPIQCMQINLKMLNEIVEQKELDQINNILSQSGWEPQAARILADDFINEISRGILFITNSEGHSLNQENEHDSLNSLFFIKSIKHLWLFRLPRVKLEKKRTANLVSAQDIPVSIIDFLQ